MSADVTSKTIGTILNDDVARDAIHIAVAPMLAAHDLAPGEHVAILGDDLVGYGPNPVGIVDPYLTAKVEKGQRFWVFLYPNTITSLRHQWTHPAFMGLYTPEKSKKWVAQFAEQLGQNYDSLMAAATDMIEYGRDTYDNTETYKDYMDWWPTFWKHFTAITGKEPVGTSDCPFVCAC